MEEKKVYVAQKNNGRGFPRPLINLFCSFDGEGFGGYGAAIEVDIHGILTGQLRQSRDIQFAVTAIPHIDPESALGVSADDLAGLVLNNIQGNDLIIGDVVLFA